MSKGKFVAVSLLLSCLTVYCHGSAIMCYQCSVDNKHLMMTTLQPLNNTGNFTTTMGPTEFHDCSNGTQLPYTRCTSGGCGHYIKKYPKTGLVIQERMCGCTPPESTEDEPWTLDMTCCVEDYCNCPQCENRHPPTTTQAPEITTQKAKDTSAGSTITGSKHLLPIFLLTMRCFENFVMKAH